MLSKNTILTEKKLSDIEDIIGQFDKFVSANDIRKAIGKKYSKLTVKKRIYELKAKGWLVSLRKGLYFVSDIMSRGFVSVSPFVVAKAYEEESYISLDSAFSHYGLFSQLLRTVSSVTTQKSRKYSFQDNIYQYSKIRKELFFGFKTESIEGYYVKIAELEKVILDYLYFKSDAYSTELLIEIFKKAQSRIDYKKLFDYAKQFPSATQRKLGFILDLLVVNTDELKKGMNPKGYSKMTPRSDKFNAKWRIYYEDRFTQ